MFFGEVIKFLGGTPEDFRVKNSFRDSGVIDGFLGLSSS